MLKKKNDVSSAMISKSPSGIRGFDEITGGGLPKGRLTLVCGGPGCGKSLFGVEYLVRGAARYDEPGVFVSFEESAEEIISNVASLGFDLPGLIARKKLLVEYIHVDRSEIEETGEYDLEGLFVRLSHAIDSVGAKRVVLDTIESLFSGLKETIILRAELRRLFRWLKEKGVTAVVTGERGEGSLTRYSLEEYVSDCVIFLDHRVQEEFSTRRLRVVKYRGTTHGENEYPFLIDETGFSVLPLTSLSLEHAISNQRIPSGFSGLDEMLGGKGYYRGSTVLVSGTAGTGKSSMAAYFAEATCRRGERCLYFAFEEPVSQILRNMRSIGVDLEPWVKKGLLQFHAIRATHFGLEMHLVTMHKLIRQFRPKAVIVDPITNLSHIGFGREVQSVLTRLIDLLKMNNITALFTSLTTGGKPIEQSEVGISSLIDTWVLLTDLEEGRERNRGIQILKSRGMAHSNQLREFMMTGRGLKLVDVYLGRSGVLTGSARVVQEAQDRAGAALHRQDVEQKRRSLSRKRKRLAAEIAALQADLEQEEAEFQQFVIDEDLREGNISRDRDALARSRKTENGSAGTTPRKKKSSVRPV